MKSQIAPKSLPNRPKTTPRGTRNQSKVFKATWGRSGGRFHRYPGAAMVQLGAQNRPKTEKKQNQKSSNFRSPSCSKNIRKWTPKPLPNRVQYGRKWVPIASRSKNEEKCKNEQLSYVLARFWVSAGVENRRGNRKKGVENTLEFKCDFEVDFLRIFCDFGAILGPKMDPKSKKRESKNRAIFRRSWKIVGHWKVVVVGLGMAPWRPIQRRAR